MGEAFQTGFYSVDGDTTGRFLIRRSYNSEWFSIYRKNSLPSFDYAAENCDRLILLLAKDLKWGQPLYIEHEGGISDKTAITAFCREIRTQEEAGEAGLLNLVKKSDGTYENVYVYGAVFGLFDEEPNLALKMEILSYNDLAFSKSLEGKAYVLPREWLERLLNE